ncbi:hypothetical protein COCON_G00035890 [Conger conger]|uniref:Uncharacterized protein n=1 Tax=Conger conger TaxID=82655 RepID=A0A9Q1E072_CONCO|nr:hypothetical protein COCON_G00035890 [Conger conger]
MRGRARDVCICLRTYRIGPSITPAVALDADQAQSVCQKGISGAALFREENHGNYFTVLQHYRMLRRT